MQVGAGFQQVSGEAVPEHVGIDLLLNPGAACRILAGMSRGLSINRGIAAVPAIAGKQPDGFSAQATPMSTEFIEQNGAEHHVTILATLAALDVDHHASAIDIADL